MKTKWEHGALVENWMEDPGPSGTGWTLMFEYSEIPAKSYNLIRLLSALNVIDHGVVYETVEQIRIAD